MADFGQPIAQDVNVNPAQGIQTLSGLYGLQEQQQRIALTKAWAQQAQQETQEKQALGQFTISAMNDTAYRNADGSLNTTKFQTDASKVAPVFGQQYIGQMTTNADEAVDNRNALLKLSNEQRATVSQYLSALSQKPNATMSDYLDMIERVRSVSDDPGFQRAVDFTLAHAPQTGTLTSANASATLRQYAGRQAQGVAQVTAPGSGVPGSALQAPSTTAPTAPGAAPPPAPPGSARAALNAPLSPQQVDAMRVASQQYGNTANAPQYAAYTAQDSRTHYAQVNPNAPGGQRADIGTTLPQGMTPSERYNVAPGPNNQLMVIDRQTGRGYTLGVGGASSAAAPGGGATAPGTVAGRGGVGPLTADTDPQKPGPNDPGWRQQSYGALVTRAQHDVLTAQDADASYQTNMATADQIRRLSSGVNTGPGTTAWTRALGTLGSRLGAQNVADTQTLASFLDLQSTRLRDSMGLPATNAGLATSQEMGTSVESQRNAIQAKTDYYQALTALQHSYRTGLDQAGNGGVNSSPTEVSRFKSQFTKNADPIAMEIKLALQRGDASGAQRILQGLSPQQRALIAQHGRYLDSLPQ